MSTVTRTATIDAAPERIVAIMLDVVNHHTWQKEVQSIQVLEADDQGRPLATRVHISAMGQVASYSVQYTHTSAGSFEYHLLDGDMMTLNDFTLAVEPAEGGSAVRVTQAIDLKWPLPGFMIDQLTLKGVKDMLKGLTAQAVPAAPAAPAPAAAEVQA